MDIQSPKTVVDVASAAEGNTVGATSSGRVAPGRGWSDWPLATKGIAVLAVPLLMLVLASVIFYTTTASETSAEGWVTHTLTVQNSIRQVTNDILAGETGIGSYLITNDSTFLDPVYAARAAIGPELTTLGRLVADNPVEVARVAHLRELIGQGYQFSLASIPPASDAAGRSDWLHQRKVSTDAIRAVLVSMNATEERLLGERARTAARDRSVASLAVGLAMGAGLLVGAVLMVFFTRSLTRRLRRLLDDANRLRDGEPLGEADSSRDELGVLSRHLGEAVSTQRALEADARAARGVAESASNEKSRFLSRMSHELRTPLNAVLGFAQLLEMDAEGEQRESLVQIRRAGRHLLDLINEVLDISRIESGTMTFSSEPVRLSELIGEVGDLLAPMARERRVSLATTAANDCPYYVHADRQRAKQILLNLVSNAVKYNRAGGSVSFACELVDDAVQLDVIDTGIGMSEHDLARLFTPFERFAAAESDIEGSGIGLVLSLHLAQAMGGQLTATSQSGEGTTFRLRLPLASAPSSSDVAPPSAAVVTSANHGSASLLYVEDNASNVRLLEQILHRRPHWELTHAGHGQMGLDLAATRAFDLVLLDLHLPDMGGAEVLGHLRANPLSRGVPIVVVSADATPGQVERLIGAGANDYITKPIDVEELLGLLDTVSASLPKGEG